MPLQQVGKEVADGRRMERLAVRPSEHKVEVRPVVAHQEPVLKLPGALLAEERDEPQGDREGSAAPLGLRSQHDWSTLAFHSLKVAGHLKRSALQIHVGPFEGQQLATAEAEVK